jgi:hypothetical protein
MTTNFHEDGNTARESPKWGAIEMEEKLEQAKVELCELLKNGPIEATEVLRRLRRKGISEKTIYRAKTELQVESRKMAFGEKGHWTWLFPEHQRPPAPAPSGFSKEPQRGTAPASPSDLTGLLHRLGVVIERMGGMISTEFTNGSQAKDGGIPCACQAAQPMTPMPTPPMPMPPPPSTPLHRTKAEAARWLRAELGDYRVPVAEIFHKGMVLGFLETVLRQVKKEIGAESVWDSVDKRWCWQMPDDTPDPRLEVASSGRSGSSGC